MAPGPHFVYHVYQNSDVTWPLLEQRSSYYECLLKGDDGSVGYGGETRVGPGGGV